LLRRYPGKTTGRVDGIAASAASLLLMGCSQIVMPSNAMLMIHNPHTLAAGDEGELRRLADLLGSTSANMLTAYAERSGQTEDKVRELMDAETWLTASPRRRRIRLSIRPWIPSILLIRRPRRIRRSRRMSRRLRRMCTHRAATRG
ncbi:Clp protease ClpP, partial [Burkholderia multivorans]|uniref:Clp protease ClpP n=1 Tax=Burkholderia multivorans TaxID=87883 RepID=UPI001FC8BCFB